MAVEFLGNTDEKQSSLLNKEVVEFITILHRSFNTRRKELLQARVARQRKIDSGYMPNFLKETEYIRSDPNWRGAKPAPGLEDRRVEITGPPERKMIINALNANVKTYMSDFEDSSAPTWENMISGQANLYDAVRSQIDFEVQGKQYQLRTDQPLPTLIVRPRGWHLEEKHVLVDGEPVSASIFDFGLYFFHNAKTLVETGKGPYFYLPKMESHLEARLWNDIFNVSQDYIKMPRGTIRATVLIENILAAFEMDEFIYELRDHSSGLNCGRWDYIFSFIKKFRKNSKFVLPDRSDVTMTCPFMDSYVQLLIKTCHKRGVHAMGGMAAQIPIKSDPESNETAMSNVRKDKIREVTAGHDGTWVAHPVLANIAMEVFNKHMPLPNQIYNLREDVDIKASQLINPKVSGKITIQGIEKNIDIGICYMEAWLRGIGCIPIYNLMEDAATAEVSRSQIWQWVRHKVTTAEGKKVTQALVQDLLHKRLRMLLDKAPPGNKFELAAKYFEPQVLGDEFADFIPSLLYNEIVTKSASRL